MNTPAPRPRPPAGPSTPKPKPGPKAVEALYPVAELAELWRCTPKHIYNLIAKGELRSTQIAMGKAKTRVSESAIAEFVARRTSKARAA